MPPELRILHAQRLQKQVRALNLDYSHLLDGGYDAVMIHFNGIVVDANDAFAQLIAGDLNNIIGLNGFTLYHPDSVRNGMERLQTGSEVEYEMRWRTLAGNDIDVSIRPMNFKLNDQQGRVLAIKKL